VVQTLVMAMVTLTSLVLLTVLVVRVSDRPEPEPGAGTDAGNRIGTETASAPAPRASGPDGEAAAAAAPGTRQSDTRQSDTRQSDAQQADGTRADAGQAAHRPAVSPRSEERMVEISQETFGPLEPLVGGVWETGEPGTVSWSRSVFRPLLGGSFVEHRLWGLPGAGASEVLISQTVYRWDRAAGTLTADGYARNGTASERTLEVGEPLPPGDIEGGSGSAGGPGGRAFSSGAVALIGYTTEETADDLFEYRQEIVLDPAARDRYVWRVFRSPLGELEWTPTASFEFVRARDRAGAVGGAGGGTSGGGRGPGGSVGGSGGD